MIRSALRWLCALAVLVSTVACSGTRQPPLVSLACDANTADLVIRHEEVGGIPGWKDREVTFRPPVPMVQASATVGELCVFFEPAKGGWKAVTLSNFQDVGGGTVTATPSTLSLTEKVPSGMLEVAVGGSGDVLVKFDLSLYRGNTTNGRPALLIDPVLMIRR